VNVLYAIFAVVSTLLIVFASSIPQGTLPGSASKASQILSNPLHIPAFAALSFFWLKSFKKSADSAAVNLAILVGLLLFGISDEIHQSFVPGRTPSLMDMCLNLLGIIAGLSIFNAFRRKNTVAICVYGSNQTHIAGRQERIADWKDN